MVDITMVNGDEFMVYKPTNTGCWLEPWIFMTDFPWKVGNGMSSSQLTSCPSFFMGLKPPFRGVGQPPTSLSFCCFVKGHTELWFRNHVEMQQQFHGFDKQIKLNQMCLSWAQNTTTSTRVCFDTYTAHPRSLNIPGVINTEATMPSS